MRKRIVLVFLVIGLVTGCASSAGSDASDRVVAAFYPLAFAAEQSGSTDVVDLTPPGAEPHDVELSAGDVREVKAARLVLYLGQGFQPALERAVAERDGPSLDLLDGQPLLRAPGGEVDPHVWLDPVRYADLARRIAGALGDPASAKPLIDRLVALDRSFRAGLAACERRELVTSHAAFAYLAARYRLEQVPLAGVAPEVEPNAKAVVALVEDVRRTGATTVFFEPLASRELAETVAREAGVETAVLDPLEGLQETDAERGADYFSVMRANLAALRKALGCR